ncbi:Uncharacterized protein Rs2_28960 [Raphanus sativus]|nr:Uncharacterized protein Rs2_28960 [Raphanus sativus]
MDSVVATAVCGWDPGIGGIDEIAARRKGDDVLEEENLRSQTNLRRFAMEEDLGITGLLRKVSIQTVWISIWVFQTTQSIFHRESFDWVFCDYRCTDMVMVVSGNTNGKAQSER